MRAPWQWVSLDPARFEGLNGSATPTLIRDYLNPRLGALETALKRVDIWPMLPGEVGVKDPIYFYGDVRRYGAIGDGATDARAAIQNAYASVVALGGGAVIVPPTNDGFLVGSTVELDESVAVVFGGAGSTGRLVVTGDIEVINVTGSNITVQDLRIERTPSAGTKSQIVVNGSAERIRLQRLELLGSSRHAIDVSAAVGVWMEDIYAYRPYEHGITVHANVDDVSIEGVVVIEAGYNNANPDAGKGIGVSTGVTNARIDDVYVKDSNQIGIELFGASGDVDPVEFFTITNCVIEHTGDGAGGLSLDNARDGTVAGVVVRGSTRAFEVAGGSKRVSMSALETSGCSGVGLSVSNNSGDDDNDPEDITVSSMVITEPESFGIQITKAKSFSIETTTVRGGGNRGIFLNDCGSGSVIRLNNITVQDCARSGVYLFLGGATSGQAWDVAHVTALGNNTSATANESTGIYLNADTADHQGCVRMSNNTGELVPNVVSTLRTSNLALSASTTASIGVKWQYRIGERWEAVYRIPITVTGGVVGLTWSFATLPAGVVGRLRVFGTTTDANTFATEQTTALTTPTATGFLVASFTGFVDVVATLRGGSADGVVDLQVTTGAAAAGNILSGTTVELRWI